MRVWKRTIDSWPYLCIMVSVLGFVYLAMSAAR
jgi:hypothetical protein